MKQITSTPALKVLYNDASGAFSFILKHPCYPAAQKTILKGVQLDHRPAETVTDRTMTKFRALIARAR